MRGLSVRDVEATLTEALGEAAAVSKSTVSRVCEEIATQFEQWSHRRLDEVELDYLFLDGSHFKYHANASAEPVLAAWGIDTDGKPVFVGLDAASSESGDAWEGFLTGLGERGLGCPLLVISDGAPGLIAVERTMGAALRQRCLVHRAIQAIRQDGWTQTLPTTAVFFPGDMPPRPPRVTRHVAEHIMAQVEAPANLDRWPNSEGRLITIILIRCGLRATDVCTLAFDCLLRDGQGAPYLRYFNNKMRREAAVPIDEELESEIRAQQHRVSARWPERHPHLFPALVGNAGGQNPITY